MSFCNELWYQSRGVQITWLTVVTKEVIPVFKSGNKDSPLNYRPISLTSIPCKIMEHVIYSQIMDFLGAINFFHPSQHGFRKGLSCETQLAVFLHDVHSNLDLNLQTDAIFLDFDKVPHRRLLLKLHPNVVLWIEELLSNRSQFVLANSQFQPSSSNIRRTPRFCTCSPPILNLHKRLTLKPGLQCSSVCRRLRYLPHDFQHL